MDARTEHASREAETWSRLQAALERIPRERWDEPEAIGSWSVKELLWHVAGWIDKAGDDLEAIAAGTFEDVDEGDERVDERNDELTSQAREMDVGAVWTGLLASRERLLARWSDLPEVGRDAVETFSVETYEHYEEHLPELEAVAPDG